MSERNTTLCVPSSFKYSVFLFASTLHFDRIVPIVYIGQAMVWGFIIFKYKTNLIQIWHTSERVSCPLWRLYLSCALLGHLSYFRFPWNLCRDLICLFTNMAAHGLLYTIRPDIWLWVETKKVVTCFSLCCISIEKNS